MDDSYAGLDDLQSAMAWDSSAIGLQQLDYGFLPEIDSGSMSVRFRICTPHIDREGDIIEPSGVMWENYRMAPVVKYEHGFSGISLPIARSADNNGLLHVSYGDSAGNPEMEDALYARAFFSERNELSAQMFGLIDEGFLRAASIHVLPVEGSYRKLPNEGTHAFESDLLEWSVCTVAVNPNSYAKSLKKDSRLSELLNLQLDAASKILERKTIGTRTLLPSIAKCLSTIQPPKQFIRGHNPNEENMSKKILTKADVDKLTPIALAKAVADPTAYDADSLKLLRAKAKSYDEESMTKMGTETDESMTKMADVIDPESMPKADEMDIEVEDDVVESTVSPGADFLAAIHGSIGELIAKLEGAAKATEKPEVLEFAASFAEELNSALVSCEGAYSSIYPDAPALAKAEEPMDTEMIKSWIAGASSNAYKLEGLATRLAKCLNNPKALKDAAARTARDLKLLNSQAKSWKPKVNDSAVTVEQFNALQKSLSDLVAKISRTPA
jgi:hypothetical protein